MSLLETLELKVENLIERLAKPEEWTIDITREEEPDSNLLSDLRWTHRKLSQTAWSPPYQSKARDLKRQLENAAWKQGLSAPY